MTEAEAIRKWCPFVRIARREEVETPAGSGLTLVHTQLVGGCNTDALGGTRVPASCRCIASECMAWRWEGRGVVDNGVLERTYASDTEGYCGLAGNDRG